MTDDFEDEKPARKKAVTMTSRSLQWLRKNGFIAAVTEQWVRFPKKVDGRMIFANGKPVMDQTRRDLYGFCDILAVKLEGNVAERGCFFVQTTTTANQAARLAKLEGIRAVYQVLQARNRVQVHGWAKKGARGKRKLWQVTVTEVLLKENGLLAFVSRAEDEVEDDGKPVENLFGRAGGAPAVEDNW